MDAVIVPPDITSVLETKTVLETTNTKVILSSCAGMPSSILCRLANDATLRETRFIPGANLQKSTGNISATRSPELLNTVIDFIKDKGDREGEVYATIIIRTLTGHELRDEEKGAVDLPTNTSCREMYEKFCFDRGWAPKSDSNGRYPKVCEYPNRKTNAMFWRDDADQTEVCSW
jgi:hypothetical protein